MLSPRETNRVATIQFLEELGYDPSDVFDRRGDALLEWDEGIVELEILNRDDDGHPIRLVNKFSTRTERVNVTAERFVTYLQAARDGGH